MSEVSRTPPTTPVGDVGRLTERLAGAEGLLVAVDFDGTLAPIAEDPETPTVTPSNRRALDSLAAHPATAVAVVSGRELSDLRSRVDVDGVRYVGNHGLQVADGDRVTVHPLAAEHRPSLERARVTLEERLDDVPGVEVEDKRLTLTVHYRRVSRDRVEEVAGVVTDVVASTDRLRITTGKQVSEIRPAIGCDKGAAVRRLARDVPDGWRTVYVGDDTTDEDAFRALGPGDVGVVVGSHGTDATHRLPGQRGVSPLLDWLATHVLEERR